MISVKNQFIKEISESARRAFPDECCGLLAGKGDIDDQLTITQLRASTNLTTSSPRVRFEVDPKVHFNFIHELEGTNERVIGHYHSHPNQPARPSKQDLKMAYDPKMLWVIISLDANGIKEVRAYRIIESLANFQEIPLFISTNHQSNK